MIQLRFRQWPAKLELTSQRPFLALEINKPQIELKTRPPQLQVEQARGILELDFTPFKESLGIRTHVDLARHIAQEGRAAALEAIGRISQEGDMLARIEDKQDVIVLLAQQKGDDEGTLTLGSIAPPHMRYNLQPARIEVVSGTVDLTLHWGQVRSHLYRGTVTGTMIQYQGIQFWTVGKVIDRYG